MKNVQLLAVLIVVMILAMWFYNKNTQPTFVTDSNVEVTLKNASSTDTVQGTSSVDIESKAVYKMNNTKKIMNATFHTNKGDITIELFDKKSPKTVENFVKLAQSNFYNGVKFHRVIKGFMIQGGDPLTKDDSQSDYWGTGGPGYKFADEISSDNHNDVGTIAMANAGPNTNGSQFFINVNANNFLDTKHTVFGKVVKGMEVVKAIEVVQTVQDRPIEPVVINSISF
jgi:cyclophilin family peptidyl-prolyl cis-trans isomerase